MIDEATRKQIADAAVEVGGGKKIVIIDDKGVVKDLKGDVVDGVDLVKVHDLAALGRDLHEHPHVHTGPDGQTEIHTAPVSLYVEKPHRPAKPHDTPPPPAPKLIGKTVVTDAAKKRADATTKASIKKLSDRYAELDPVSDRAEMDKIKRRIERKAQGLGK